MRQIIAGFIALCSVTFTGYTIAGLALVGPMNNAIFKSILAVVFLYGFMQFGKANDSSK